MYATVFETYATCTYNLPIALVNVYQRMGDSFYTLTYASSTLLQPLRKIIIFYYFRYDVMFYFSEVVKNSYCFNATMFVLKNLVWARSKFVCRTNKTSVFVFEFCVFVFVKKACICICICNSSLYLITNNTI